MSVRHSAQEPPWPSGCYRACCLLAATICVATFAPALLAMRPASPPVFVSASRPALGGLVRAPEAKGELADAGNSRLSSRTIDFAGVLPCCIGAVLLALGSRMSVRATRRAPQRTALGSARVVCVAAPAAGVTTRKKAACVPREAVGQGGIHASGVSRPQGPTELVVEVTHSALPGISSPVGTVSTPRAELVAGVRHMTRSKSPSRGFQRRTAFTSSSAAGGEEQRQRRRLGAKFQRSAFAPRIESYDPSRLRTVIQAGQQRANNMRVSNGHEWESSATGGSSACRALSSTEGRNFVMISGHRRSRYKTE